MPNIPIPYPWAYCFCNSATFGTFKEFIAREQVSVMNQLRIVNSNIAVLNVPTNSNRKHILLYL